MVEIGAGEVFYEVYSFLHFDFLVEGVCDWSFDLVSALIFGLMMSYVGFVGFGLEEFW